MRGSWHTWATRVVLPKPPGPQTATTGGPVTEAASVTRDARTSMSSDLWIKPGSIDGTRANPPVAIVTARRPDSAARKRSCSSGVARRSAVSSMACESGIGTR